MTNQRLFGALIIQALMHRMPALRIPRESNQVERVCGRDCAFAGLAALARFDMT